MDAYEAEPAFLLAKRNVESCANSMIDDVIHAEGQRPPLLYHYTNQAGLEGIVGNWTIWATDFRCFEDEQELNYAKGLVAEQIAGHYDPEVRQMLNASFLSVLELSATISMHYIASFCARDDVPSMWNQYADHGQGYALGFALDDLAGLDHVGERRTILPVEYRLERQRELVRRLVDSLAQAVCQVGSIALFGSSPAEFLRVMLSDHFRPAREALGLLMAAFKQPSFGGECEWRLAVTTYGRLGPQFGPLDNHVRCVKGQRKDYIALPLQRVGRSINLKAVVYGARLDPASTESALRVLLGGRGVGDCEVRQSSWRPEPGDHLGKGFRG